MKAVILAGGFGSRIAEESHIKPKPMIEIGGKPILWHIMKTYSQYGINEFVICLGYKGYMIKEYFANYYLHASDVTVDIKSNSTIIHTTPSESWKIDLIDTGESSMTGGRLKKVGKFLNETFCLTYGDGLTDLDVSKVIEFHKKNNFMVTVTAVQPKGRFGGLELNGNKVTQFNEKPPGDGGWINGGYFVMEPQFLDYIDDDFTILEQEPLMMAAKNNNLIAFKHTGFWHAMDTLRDKDELERLWKTGNAPWKIW